MDPVATQYVDRDGAAVAYQVVGDGPADVVHFYECFQHLDLQLTDPDINYNVERMARFSRSVYFQRRGFGLSDHVAYVPTIEQQADDVLAIMDAVGMRRAALVGWVGTCGPLALVAARSPDRVNSLSFMEPRCDCDRDECLGHQEWRAAASASDRTLLGESSPQDAAGLPLGGELVG